MILNSDTARILSILSGFWGFGDAVLVKRIQKIYSKARRLIKLKLISDNYLEHDPIILNLHQVRKIMKVERKLAAI